MIALGVALLCGIAALVWIDKSREFSAEDRLTIAILALLLAAVVLTHG